MPNPHNRKSFQEALAKVEINDKLLTEAYAIADQEKMTDKQLREFFEILGGLAAGAAIAAPAIATGVGMYRKAKKEKQERQDLLDTETRARQERVTQADLTRGHASSEAALNRQQQSSENLLGREHTTKERRETQSAQTREANRQRKENRRSAKKTRQEGRRTTVAKAVTQPGLTPAQLSAMEAQFRRLGIIK